MGFAAGYLPLPERSAVREFLTLFGKLYGLADPKAAIDAALDRFGITHLAANMGNQLSSGQRTLVGIVKATLHRPNCSSWTSPPRRSIPMSPRRSGSGLARLCAEDNTALLVTSHNMTEVERLCQRVVFLSGGRVVADGSPKRSRPGSGAKTSRASSSIWPRLKQRIP